MLQLGNARRATSTIVAHVYATQDVCITQQRAVNSMLAQCCRYMLLAFAKHGTLVITAEITNAIDSVFLDPPDPIQYPPPLIAGTRRHVIGKCLEKNILVCRPSSLLTILVVTAPATRMRLISSAGPAAFRARASWPAYAAAIWATIIADTAFASLEGILLVIMKTVNLLYLSIKSKLMARWLITMNVMLVLEHGVLCVQHSLDCYALL